MGFFLASLTAFFEAGRDLALSGDKAKAIPPFLRAWWMLSITLPLVSIVALVRGIQLPSVEFWWLVGLHAVLMTLAHFLYMRALSLGPVSQTQPILALTTVFLVVTNPIMTDESVGMIGWIGVVAVGLGVYGTTHSGQGGWISPFAEMIRQPGVKSKFGVAIIFSVTANLDRLCLDAAGRSGITYLFFDLALTWALLTIAVARLHGWRAMSAPPHLALLASGSCNTASILCHVAALNFLSVPFVIAIKRLSIVFTSIWGYAVRRERRHRWFHIVGIVMVSLGIFLIQLGR